MSTQGLLCSALERLNELLKCKTTTVKGVLDRAVEQLNSDLGGVADILSDVDADAEMNRRVRELAYDIEDSVECFVRRQEAETSSSASKWSTYLRCLYKYCASERSFLEDVHVFSRRAWELRARELTVIGSSSSSRDAGAQLIIDRQSIPDTNYGESAPIGLDKYKEDVMGLLGGQQGGLRLSVIAICGMGGIGKTTLARLVYNDPQSWKYFDCHAWGNVGQHNESRVILESLLSSLHLNTRKKEFAAVETGELAEILYKSLFGRRYLICLDDVWDADTWDSLCFVFPDNHNGSRILITTRSKEIAFCTSGSTRPILMEFLTEEQSWQLLLTKSGLHHDQGNGEREEIVRQILKSCGGLPLAITVLGQMMSGKSLQDLKLLLRNLHSDQEENVLRILDLSYEYLPFRLKPCSLYMGHFPPDQPISVDKLHLLWMAEGLISNRKEADDYFKELDNRNFVNVDEKEDLLSSRTFRYCRVHNLVHDFCISRGKLEEFFEVVDFSHAKELSTSTCRLAVYLDKFKETNDDTLNIPDAKRIRSVLFFDTVEPEPRLTWPSEVADLTNFQHIRVLDFDGVDFRVKKLPRGIEKLVYLRHLSFRGCYLQEFPSSFGNFSFLVTLDLRVIDTCIMTIPNVLRKLSRLRHLYFPLAFRCNGKDKLKLDCLKSLEVVENFDAGSCDAEDLLQMENLQILTAIVDANNLDLQRIIEKMKSISELSLVVKRFDCYSKERLNIVAELLQCNVLHALELDLEGHLGAFPNGIALGLNFTDLVFNGSEFSENPMPILGKLPKLRSLVLCNDAFLGSKLACDESDSFPQLKSLKLATLQYLEEWEVKSGAMLRLTTLAIEQCQKLKMLPSQLPNIPTLKKLMIGSMPEEFQQTIQEAIGRSNNISVTFYDC